MSTRFFVRRSHHVALSLIFSVWLVTACSNQTTENESSNSSSGDESTTNVASNVASETASDDVSDATAEDASSSGSGQKEQQATQQTDRPYINRLLPGAQRIQDEYGVPIETTIAIAIQETGWGKSVIGQNNHFGLRCASDDCVTINGIQYETCPDAEECFNIFAESIIEMSSERPGDLRVLYKNGYATSSNWVRRVRRIRGQVRKTLREAGISPTGEAR